MKTNPLPIGSPNLNGRCERFIETIKLECLRKFIIFGKRHLDYLNAEFVIYYRFNERGGKSHFVLQYESGRLRVGFASPQG